MLERRFFPGEQRVQGLLGYQLYACGEKGPPRQITFSGDKYRLSEVLKHDFFAATALYESCNGEGATEKTNSARIVLKLNRQYHFLGLPLLWLGEAIREHEVSIMNQLSDLEGTPQFLSRYGRTGLIYEYIEGRSLDEELELPKDFFDKLQKLLEEVHQREIAYLDMNKRSNILLGSDKRPYLIDFQISLHIGEYLLVWRRLSRYLREALQSADLYHLFKHKRRLCSELLRPEEQAKSRYNGGLIGLHRSVATPYRKIRRAVLKFLYKKKLVSTEKNARCSKENDIAHYMK